MPDNGFSLTRIFPYNDKIKDSVVTLENRVRENPCFGIFYTVNEN